MVGYVCDDRMREDINRDGRNYWDIYIGEICGQIGLTASTLSPADLESADALGRLAVLIIGRASGWKLSDAAKENLRRWVKAGGILVGFAVRGLDDVFGTEHAGYHPQGIDDYAVNSSFRFKRHVLTERLQPFCADEQKLLIFSDVVLTRCRTAEKVAYLYSGGRLLDCPAVTWNSYGKGYAGYFAFDAAKTVWLLHQGRPVPESRDDQGLVRTEAMSLVGDNSRRLPYADLIVFLIRNMAAFRPIPFIHEIPPSGGEIPEAMLYWGGDEYFGPVERSLGAAEFMGSVRIPYQINVESKKHPMTPGEWKRITDSGCLVSLYVADHDNHNLTEKVYAEQADVFEKRFGYRPVAVVNHSLRWRGWTTTAEWMEKAGILADNSFSCNILDHAHSNGPAFGFAFGTSFPFFFYRDHTGANRRMKVMEQPIVCYEVGHQGSVPYYDDKETPRPFDMHLPAEMALHYHLVMNMFYHPIYLAEYPRAREGVQELLRYFEYRKVKVLHTHNTGAAKWWLARSESSVDDWRETGSGVQFRTVCRYDDGMVVKVPVRNGAPGQVSVNGKKVVGKVAKEFGTTWLYIIVPEGESSVAATF